MATLLSEDVHTRLVDKHHSPLIIRKYTRWGFPIYVAIISDDDLSDLDDVVIWLFENSKETGWVNNIQKIRDMAGAMTEAIVDHYKHAEGVGVVFYVDKMMVSSLYGDFMNHHSCRVELLSYLNLMAHI